MEKARGSNNKTSEVVDCRYFLDSGPKNTEATLEAAFERAKILKIKKILVPSCSGKTAFKALDLFGEQFSLIIVTHVTGFKKPDYQELPEKDRKLLLGKGAPVLPAQHAFGGVGRAFRNKTGPYQIDEIIAYTLRTFGQGTKVAIEITLMAADAGLIRNDEDVISIGGTVSGVDTALVLRPSHTEHFFDLKVKEIICKPSDF
ncbi:MAG: pyruvate kinase alpha/beta domain-containing protein [Desulfatiglandales bacterium]